MASSCSPVASIDIGSNTILLLLGNCSDDGDLVPVLTASRTARLGEGLRADGSLDPQAAARALEAVRELAGVARGAGAVRIAAAGTSALRECSGAAGLLAEIERVIGEPPVVVSGALEAELAYEAAAMSGAASGFAVVIDIGGRSTEVIIGSGDSISFSVSLPAGAARLTYAFLKSDPYRPDELQEARASVRELLRSACFPSQTAGGAGPRTVVCIGGTGVTLARIHDPSWDTGSRPRAALEASFVPATIDRLARMTSSERLHIPGLPPDRAPIITAGCLILDILISHFRADRLQVTTYGMRHAVARRMLLGLWPPQDA